MKMWKEYYKNIEVKEMRGKSESHDSFLNLESI